MPNSNKTTKTITKKPRSPRVKKSIPQIDPVSIALHTAAHATQPVTVLTHIEQIESHQLPRHSHPISLPTPVTPSLHVLDLHDITLEAPTSFLPATFSLTPHESQHVSTQTRVRRAWSMLFPKKKFSDTTALDLRPKPVSQFPPKDSRNFLHALTLTWREWIRRRHASPSIFTLITAIAQTHLVEPWKKTTPLVAVAPTPALPHTKSIGTQPTHSLSPLTKTILMSALTIILLLTSALTIGAITLVRQRETITKEAKTAINFLTQGSVALQSQNPIASLTAFAKASQQFNTIQKQIGVLGRLTLAAATIIPTTNPIRTVGPLLTTGEEFATIGTTASKTFLALAVATTNNDRITLLQNAAADVLPRINRIHTTLASLPLDAVPKDAQPTVEKLQQQFPTITQNAKKINKAIALAPDILGMIAPRRYLLLFQNNAELRPTGGFIGSFALVDVANGELKNWEIPGGGSYDLKGSLRTRVASPQPLHLINPEWQFQDTNWYADFPTSAQTISDFYEKSGGPTTDGIIAINARLVEKILDIIGPIVMVNNNKIITSKNFTFETQKSVELEYDKTQNKPKQFIADLWPAIIEKIKSAPAEQQVQMAQLLDQSLSEKDVLLWMRNTESELRVRNLGWAGDIKTTSSDYLAIVHTNIAGQKTDSVMSEVDEYTVKVLPDSSAVATLTVRRTHNGKKGELFRGVRNVDYVRVYAPLGSKLIDAQGFSAPDATLFKLTDPTLGANTALAMQENDSVIDPASLTRTTTESSKTVFGNWVQTDPGKTSTITLTYALPARTLVNTKSGRRANYSLLIQKQPGANPSQFTSRLILPRTKRIAWQSPERNQDENGDWITTQELRQDTLFSTILDERQ